MRIHRRAESTVKLTAPELIAALGLNDEGNLDTISVDWDPDFHRSGVGASVVKITIIKHNFFKRQPRPKR